MLDGEVDQLRAYGLLVNAIFAAAFDGSPKPLGVGGIIGRDAILGVEFQDDVRNDFGFRRRAGLIALTRNHDLLDAEETGEFLQGESGGAVTTGIGLRAVRD